MRFLLDVRYTEWRDEAEETIRRPKITADEMVLESDSIYDVWNSFLRYFLDFGFGL